MELRRTPFAHGTQLDLFVEDRSVSRVRVFDVPMHIGSEVVRCGGIGNVYTEREDRRRGYSRRVLEGAVEFMREEGYHLSALFGIEDYYHRYGFAPALIECESAVSTRRAEQAVPRYTVRPVAPQDWPAIAALYEGLRGRHTGAAVRNPSSWTGFRFGSHFAEDLEAFVVVEGGQVAGYAAYDNSRSHCTLSEVGYRGPEVFSTLLAQAARLALERRVERIRVHTPANDPFLEYLHRYGCRTEISYPAASNGMARVIDQHGLLEILRPLLAQRLRAAGQPCTGSLVLRTELGEDRVTFSPGQPTVTVEMPQWVLAQLVLGYRSAADAALECLAPLGPQTLRLLEAVFPVGYPYIWWGDRF